MNLSTESAINKVLKLYYIGREQTIVSKYDYCSLIQSLDYRSTYMFCIDVKTKQECKAEFYRLMETEEGMNRLQKLYCFRNIDLRQVISNIEGGCLRLK